MLLTENENTFTNDEIFLLYDRLFEVHRGLPLIQFLLSQERDENGYHSWTGTTSDLGRILGNNDSPNFRNQVLFPLIEKGIIGRDRIKRMLTRYILSENWKDIIFS